MCLLTAHTAPPRCSGTAAICICVCANTNADQIPAWMAKFSVSSKTTKNKRNPHAMYADSIITKYNFNVYDMTTALLSLPWE